MRIRNGFVSNSSSSSFVLGKYFMTPEQIKKFTEFIETEIDATDYEYDDENQGFSVDTYIYCSHEHYFHGDIDYHDTDKILNFLVELGVDEGCICIEE